MSLINANIIATVFALGIVFTIAVVLLYVILAHAKRERWPRPQDKPYLVGRRKTR